jgi:acyl carrier protein
MRQDLLHLVRSTLHVEDKVHVAEQTPLDSIGLDSVNVVNLILAIEEKFQVRISDEDLDFSDFESFGTLLIFVCNKKTPHARETDV